MKIVNVRECSVHIPSYYFLQNNKKMEYGRVCLHVTTRNRFYWKTEFQVLSGLVFRPRVSSENGGRKRIFSNMLSREVDFLFENVWTWPDFNCTKVYFGVDSNSIAQSKRIIRKKGWKEFECVESRGVGLLGRGLPTLTICVSAFPLPSNPNPKDKTSKILRICLFLLRRREIFRYISHRSCTDVPNNLQEIILN